MTDADREDRLMRQAAAGDRGAMDRLFGALSSPLYNYVLRLTGDPDQASDALQTAFLNAWQGRASFRGSGARPWLFVIARNAALNIRQRRSELSLVTEAEEQTGPADEHRAAELADRIDAALSRLPADTREAIVLSRVSGMRLDDIAALLGTSNGALRVRLSRGLARLKEAIEP